MAEDEQIVYAPEELAEIDRIIGRLDKVAPAALEESTAEKIRPAELEEQFESPAEPEELAEEEGSFEGEPEDLELPAADLESLKPKPSGADRAAGIEDITDLVHEVDEAAEAAGPAQEIETVPLEEVTESLEAVPEEEAAAIPTEELSTLDELDHLTSGEPVSLDHMEGSGPFVEKAAKPRIEKIEKAAKEAEPVKIKEPAEIPDLSDISYVEKADMPEAREEDISSIDIRDLDASAAGPELAQEEIREPVSDILTDEDLTSIEEVRGIERKEPVKKPARETAVEDLDRGRAISPEPDFQEMPPIKDFPAVEAEEPLVIEKLDSEPSARPRRERERPTGGGRLNLTDSEISRLKRSILFFNTSIRQAIKDAIINDLLSASETRQLVEMILTGRPESGIHKFLEDKLKRTIPFTAEGAVPGRRVISSRPEYTLEGRDRQKRLAKITRVFGIAALAACVLAIASYQFIYKPWAASKKIQEGAALIRETGDYLKKQKDYARAEDLFIDVDRNYIKDYEYGYTEFARAYFDKKEYGYSIGKLNKVYRIQYDHDKAVDINILNSLGQYYSKVPKEYYDGLRANINQWYYPKSAKKREDWSQLDIAIEFFRQVLIRDKKNITALFGIGNAYFYQGQYFKAKKYYEDIVDFNPNSEIGYSGLLNLYIDRDVFERVIDVHAKLSNKKMLDQVPSPLLAKLASYYLGKQKSETVNVRIDYGMQSTRFKDTDDNIFPAVHAVLEALNKRDQDYPPLHLMYARLSKAQKNLKVMKIHLDKAISSSLKKYKTDYFGALHLMGEYYYLAKEPVKAYEYLNRAIKASGNPPEFTREDFYSETENVGKSYALLGNIFYYYFDKVRMRYGDLEDENLSEEAEKFSNYQIARDKYEKALQEKYESSEVRYNLGRIYYLNRLYQKSLEQWMNLYEDFVTSPGLMLALGNAFYHLDNYNAARGEYLKLISALEYQQDKIKSLNAESEDQVKMNSFLSSAYNNLGAVYQVQNNEAKSGISYWKAINYARRINLDNEYARVNLGRSFKKARGEGEPILDESIPFSIDIYREDRRI
jgi:tetratricopeptide (TPR) repeat protein